jgi:predicted nuclease of predicted toxin-antitoxin system
MAGLGIRLYTDEMIDVRLASALRSRGYDAESCQEAGRSNREIPDEDQLTYATQQGRAIFTFNFLDFLPLDTAWKAAGRPHAGIIVSPEIHDVGELLRRMAWHLDQYTPAQQHDTLLWLGPGPRA